MKTQEEPTLPRRLPIKLAAEASQLSEKTIRRYISSGRLTAYRVGPRAIRVDRDSLLALETPIGCDHSTGKSA